MIPQAAPQLRIQRFKHAVAAAIEQVVAGGEYILGPAVAAFERAFAAFCGVEHCIAVNSGTDAITIALAGLGIGPGDEVITTAMTAPGTALGIRRCGAEPRFVDIDPDTRCIDFRQVEQAIGPQTAAIVPVHLHGYPMDISPLRDLAENHRLAVVEDCAHAHGARRDGRHVGTLGDAGAFSFYPTKNLGALGDGGAVITNDNRVADACRGLRSYETQQVTQLREGFNSRLDALQAAVLSVLLTDLEASNQRRVRIADRFRRELITPHISLPPEHPGNVYHQFAIRIRGRAALCSRLEARGIRTGTHYALPLHRHTAFAGCAAGALPVTEMIADEILSLPIQPEVAEGHEATIVGTLCEALL